MLYKRALLIEAGIEAAIHDMAQILEKDDFEAILLVIIMYIFLKINQSME